MSSKRMKSRGENRENVILKTKPWLSEGAKTYCTIVKITQSFFSVFPIKFLVLQKNEPDS